MVNLDVYYEIKFVLTFFLLLFSCTERTACNKSGFERGES